MSRAAEAGLSTREGGGSCREYPFALDIRAHYTAHGDRKPAGDIKPESRIAVSGFQTRPHAYFVTVRAAANPLPPAPPSDCFAGPFSTRSPVCPALFSTQTTSPGPGYRVRFCHGFTNNVARYSDIHQHVRRYGRRRPSS